MNEDNLLEQEESGLSVIDAIFEKYFIKYVNAHFKKYHNSYQVGEWFLHDMLKRFMKTRVTDKKRALTAIRLTIKDANINELYKGLTNEEDLS